MLPYLPFLFILGAYRHIHLTNMPWMEVSPYDSVTFNNV